LGFIPPEEKNNFSGRSKREMANTTVKKKLGSKKTANEERDGRKQIE